MRTYDKRSLKQNNRPLSEATHSKTWRDTSVVSLALLKKEGEVSYLYPLPSRNINNLDYNEESRKTMKTVSPLPAKLTSFLFTTDALAAISARSGNASGILVLITYFDFDIMPTYRQYINTSREEDRNNPERYTSNSSTNHTDKTCIIIGVVASPYA